MFCFKKSVLVKRKEGALFMTTPKGSLPPPVLKDIEKQLDNPDIRRVVFYFDSKSEHENAVIEDICRLLVSYSDLEAKIFRRKNILFLQRPLSDTERLIRFPQGKIISSAQKCVYEGALFKPKSRLFETILDTIVTDQSRLVQFSFPVKKNTETNTDFLHRTADIRLLILKELQEENTVTGIQFFAYRNQKKELVDAYVRHENFEIKKCQLFQPPVSPSLETTTAPLPLHISKYQRKLLARQIELQQAVNDR